MPIKLSQLPLLHTMSPTDLCEVSKDLGGGTYTSSRCTVEHMCTYVMEYHGVQTGCVDGSGFVGNPKQYIVNLPNTYSDTSYIITLTGQDPRMWTAILKTTSSFVISSNSNMPVSGSVYWRTESL